MAIRVLFLCTGNSARSVIAEALLKQLGGPAFNSFSAGTHPKGINPYTARVLAEERVDLTGFGSKDVSEFIGQDFDYVITVCDSAAEECPETSAPASFFPIPADPAKERCARPPQPPPEPFWRSPVRARP